MTCFGCTSDCVRTHEQFNFVAPSSLPRSSTNSVATGGEEGEAPMVLCKALRQDTFSLGMLVIRPFEEKPVQFVRQDSMVSSSLNPFRTIS